MRKIGTHSGNCRDCGAPFAYAMFRKNSLGWRIVRCKSCLMKRRKERK